MKTMRLGSLFFVLIVLVIPAGMRAQEKPAAKLVIAFSESSCDELSAYIDWLAVPLARDPTAKGLAIFYPARKNPGSSLGPETFLRWHKERFGTNPPRIIRGRPRDAMRIEFWFVPFGADEP